jgi:hypothetical protein
MIKINLNNIGKDTRSRMRAVEWLCERYGPPGQGEWDIDKLSFVTLADDKKATYFVMRFS